MENKQKTTSTVVARKYSLYPTITVLIVSIIFMVIGFVQGEIGSYFQKAVLVCTQCIGLG